MEEKKKEEIALPAEVTSVIMDIESMAQAQITGVLRLFRAQAKLEGVWSLNVERTKLVKVE